MEMRDYNRYFLETDPKIVGEGALAIRKRTKLLSSGIASMKFAKGYMDNLPSEKYKIEFILDTINRMEDCIEEDVRKDNK